MRVLNRLQRRIQKVIQRISKRLQSVTLSDLYSKVTVPILSKSQTRILQSSQVNRHGMFVMVSHGPEIYVRLQYLGSFKINCHLNALHSKRIFVITFPPAILCQRLISDISVHLKLFFRPNCTQNHVVYVEGQSSQQISQRLEYHDRQNKAGDRNKKILSVHQLLHDTLFIAISQHREGSLRWRSLKVHVNITNLRAQSQAYVMKNWML